ncbi:MAG TPA: cyclophilin-like fold protein [Planctomycetota bacterium]|nr:cyclophilin-like fold protein [Planctomycetota bacterium]
MKAMTPRPHKRSPVPPPTRVIGKTSYDRASEKKEIARELDELDAMKQPAKRIRITAGRVQMEAGLNNSATAEKLYAILPLEASAKVWGREVYFEIPMHVEHENAQAKVPPGTIAFWPDGDCLCIFFGQTPYSPVNVAGKLDGDPNAFDAVRDGQTVVIERCG